MNSVLIDKANEGDSSTIEVRILETPGRKHKLPKIPIEQSVPQPPSTPQEASSEYSESTSVIDSGYASRTDTPTKESRGRLDDSKKTNRKKLKVFNKDVPEAFRYRFSDLRELFDASLHQYVEKKHNNGLSLGMIAWRLKVLGETEESAKPWIIVMCSSKVAKTIRKYFQQKLVRQEYQPEDTAIPSFEVYVRERPLRELAAIRVYSDAESVENESSALSGKLVYTCTDGKSRCATLGGIIKLVDDIGITTFHGMTAGHIFGDDNTFTSIGQPASVAPNIPQGEDSNSSSGNHETKDIANGKDEVDEREGEGEGFVSSLEDEYELDFDDDSTKLELSEAAAKLEKQIPADSVSIGELSLRSANIHKRIDRDLDWALFCLDPRVQRLSMLGYTWPRYNSNLECRDARPGTPVWIMTSRGALFGELQPSAFMKARRATRAIEVFVVKVASQQPGRSSEMPQNHESTISLDLGDSGSWVIDHCTQEVYGYIVASDVFQDAYVVPFNLAMADIQSATGAAACTLPTDADWSWLRAKYLLSQDSPDSGYASANTTPDASLPATPARGFLTGVAHEDECEHTVPGHRQPSNSEQIDESGLTLDFDFA